MRVTEWMFDRDEAGKVLGAFRALEGTDGSRVEDRVAFIEKMPRIRIRPYRHHSAADFLNWADRGWKGDGPIDAESMVWCDRALVVFEYELPERSV